MKLCKRCRILVSLVLLLGIRDGLVALWQQGRDEPLRVFPYRAELLPPADRIALEKGITIDDRGKLDSLIEDYFS